MAGCSLKARQPFCCFRPPCIRASVVFGFALERRRREYDGLYCLLISSFQPFTLVHCIRLALGAPVININQTVPTGTEVGMVSGGNHII